MIQDWSGHHRSSCEFFISAFQNLLHRVIFNSKIQIGEAVRRVENGFLPASNQDQLLITTKHDHCLCSFALSKFTHRPILWTYYW